MCFLKAIRFPFLTNLNLLNTMLMKTVFMELKYMFSVLALWVGIGNLVYAQSELDLMKQQFEQEAADEVNAFEAFSDSARQAYFDYVRQQQQDYEVFTDEVKDIWGGDSIIDNTRTKWVEYGNDYRSRSVVDFENGTIEVEVAVDEDASEEEVQQQLSDAVARLLDSKGSTNPNHSSVDFTQPVSQQPILQGLVDLSPYNFNGEIDWKSPLKQEDEMTERQIRRRTPAQAQSRTEKLNVRQGGAAPVPPQPRSGKTMAEKVRDGETNPQSTLADKIAADRAASEKSLAEKAQADAAAKAKLITKEEAAQSIVQTAKKTTSKVEGKDGKTRKTATVKMALATESLSKRAEQFRELVQEFSKKFQIEEPLIYAIMEQESSFNPEAKSWVPAYGLMQLVPKSGGADAYRYVYKKEYAPSSSYLYVPRNNVELGTAYLRVLMNQFAKVTDDNCRRLCVIASYNTGAGNVSRAFIGSTKLSKAFGKINELNYDQLYNYLTHNLNTDEARNYVSGVSRRREKYVKR